MTSALSILEIAGARIVTWTWQSAALATIAWFFVGLDRRHRPAFRARVWAVTLICMLLVPLLAATLELLPAAKEARDALPEQLFPSFASETTASGQNTLPSVPPPVWPQSAVLLFRVLGSIWLCGVAYRTIRNVYERRQLRRASRAARVDSLNRMAPESDWSWAGQPVPDLRMSSMAATPMVYGWVRPVIFLPHDIEAWSTAEERAVMLRHECVHLRRRDHWIAPIETLAQTLLFFHPLVNGVCRHLALERELSCDEEVLRLGSDPHCYAKTILKVAEHVITGRVISGVVSFSSGDILDRRISMMFRLRPVPPFRHLSTVAAGSLIVMVCMMGLMQVPPGRRIAISFPTYRIDTQGLPIHWPEVLPPTPTHSSNIRILSAPAVNLNSLMARGSDLDTFQAAKLEDHIERNPNDVASRVELLGYYARFKPEYAVQRAKHLHWLILNHPEIPGLGLQGFSTDFVQGRAEWLMQAAAREEDLAVLYNAASFLAEQDSAAALPLLTRGEALQLQDHRWPHRIAIAYMNQALRSDPDSAANRRDNAAQAVFHWERALQLTSVPSEREGILSSLAGAAYLAEMFDKAEGYATEVVNSSDSTADAKHNSHSVLGRLALREGDLRTAKYHLLESVNVSNQLTSFPRTRLARELLDRGERDAVTAYFRQCIAAWHPGALVFNRWIGQLASGDAPPELANFQSPL